MKWIKMDDAGSALLKSERSQRAVQLQLQPMQKVLHLGWGVPRLLMIKYFDLEV